MLPGTPAHILELVRAYTAFEQIVRDLTPGLDADHSGDAAKRLADDDANLVKADRETIKAAIEKLRETDAIFFQPAPLGQHVLRLALALNPHQDRASIASGIDRMTRADARRLAYGLKKKLAAEGTPIPDHDPRDQNIATAPPPRTAKPGGELGRGQIGG